MEKKWRQSCETDGDCHAMTLGWCRISSNGPLNSHPQRRAGVGSLGRSDGLGCRLLDTAEHGCTEEKQRCIRDLGSRTCESEDREHSHPTHLSHSQRTLFAAQESACPRLLSGRCGEITSRRRELCCAQACQVCTAHLARFLASLSSNSRSGIVDEINLRLLQLCAPALVLTELPPPARPLQAQHLCSCLSPAIIYIPRRRSHTPFPNPHLLWSVPAHELRLALVHPTVVITTPPAEHRHPARLLSLQVGRVHDPGRPSQPNSPLPPAVAARVARCTPRPTHRPPSFVSSGSQLSLTR